MEKINNYKGTFITLEKIKNIYKIEEHKDSVTLVKRLCDENIISPVKSSDLTAMYERIYTKYRIIRKDDAKLNEAIEELNYLYHPSIKIDYYRNNPSKYIDIRKYLIKLNDFIINNEELLKNKISINERSYEIFQEEKFLSSRKGKSLFNKIGWDIVSKLNVYRTPEPFIYLSTNREPKQNILIIENKDTYITASKLLINNFEILGHKISTIIYGEGEKIVSSFKELPNDSTLDYLINKENTFYYWGDIDMMGFSIYNSLTKVIDWTEIFLFEEAYKSMVQKGRNFKLGESSKDQRCNYLEGLNKIKSKEVREEILSILNGSKYIPQEILNFYDLGGNWFGNDKYSK